MELKVGRLKEILENISDDVVVCTSYSDETQQKRLTPIDVSAVLCIDKYTEKGKEMVFVFAKE